MDKLGYSLKIEYFSDSFRESFIDFCKVNKEDMLQEIVDKFLTGIHKPTDTSDRKGFSIFFEELYEEVLKDLMVGLSGIDFEFTVKDYSIKRGMLTIIHAFYQEDNKKYAEDIKALCETFDDIYLDLTTAYSMQQLEENKPTIQ